MSVMFFRWPNSLWENKIEIETKLAQSDQSLRCPHEETLGP